jgi:protoporphyrin/coproporphyrin ferrochelatase
VAFDALLVLSFGGPEGPADVMPFLDNVLRGRRVPPERKAQVASQYLEMGGRSPLNDQSRWLVDQLRSRASVPVYWGNRNWSPYLVETVGRMAADGIRRAAVFVPSAYASYSGCRQYIEDLERARHEVGPGAPEMVKIPPFYDHPGMIEPFAAGLHEARSSAGPDAPVLMSAHSIPSSAAATCDYEQQLRTAATLVSARAGELPGRWSLVFQSRSGPPSQPWLGPDVVDTLTSLPALTDAAIVVPLGFTTDHMEVVYDLDRRASRVAAERGIRLVRSATPGGDQRFVEMILDLVSKLDALGERARCALGCCPSGEP